mmetsp:Transcript_973/g.1523  ORF Transcript_973/g.1523 Transcript_973/m.1523 type:complete len:388 (+) Transcript_973:55-1218(+)
MVRKVSVYNVEGQESGSVAVPDVFSAPIRVDIVNNMHTALRNRLRQPYGVNDYAGHNVSAESWGTGRAVSRIPRVHGSGTSRSGQGAFGNMCRGGRLFSPTRVWRKWAGVVPTNQRRYAIASAIAASAEAALVKGRGHKIEEVKSVPLVVTDEIESLTKTAAAVAFLKAVNAYADVERCAASKRIRAGRGHTRNRRYKQKLGPLVVYKKNTGIVRAFNNIPGVETMSVDRLNLVRLAPGGHVGRFIIWTQSALESLKAFGSYDNKSSASDYHRRGNVYTLPRSVLFNADIDSLIQSDAIQNVVRPVRPKRSKSRGTKNNLSNYKQLSAINPRGVATKKRQILREYRRAAINAGGDKPAYVAKAAAKIAKRREALRNNPLLQSLQAEN